MKQYVYLLIAIFLMAGVFTFLTQIAKAKKKKQPTEYPYIKKPILTNAERSFYQTLTQCVPLNYVLFAKVRLWDFIDVEKSEKKYSYTNKIRSKHVDFLICNMQATPIAAVELDDKSHLEEKRRQRDEFVDKALAAAGVKVLHIQVQQTYNIDELKESLYQTINE